MSKADGNGGGGGADHGVIRHKCAVLNLTLDMETGVLEITGSAPTLELSKAICQMAADEAERKIQQRRAQQMLTIAGPELLNSLKT